MNQISISREDISALLFEESIKKPNMYHPISLYQYGLDIIFFLKNSEHSNLNKASLQKNGCALLYPCASSQLQYQWLKIFTSTRAIPWPVASMVTSVGIDDSWKKPKNYVTI